MSLKWAGLVLALVALALGWTAVRRVRYGRVFVGLLAGLSAAIIALAAAVSLGLAASFSAVDPAAEETLGSVELSRVEPGVYLATLALDDQGPTSYRLAGDHWQLDVRFLRWRLPAGPGADGSLFQLERISGRYAEPARLAAAELTAYGLADAVGRLAWRVAAEASRRLPWLDTEQGTAIYLPMSDGARYRVIVTTRGLSALPADGTPRPPRGQD